MSAKTFVDTNVLLYAYDARAGAKHQIAKEILAGLWADRTGILSLQVLQEFYVNVTRKIPVPLKRDIARNIVNSYTIWCTETTTAEIAAAFQIEDQASISFWDALIVACAAGSGAGRVLSEDLNPGQRIVGILIENPFC